VIETTYRYSRRREDFRIVPEKFRIASNG